MTINDSNWKFLHDATGLSLTYNDMYYRYLKGLGFTGTLQEMIAKSKRGLNPSGLGNPAGQGGGDVWNNVGSQPQVLNGVAIAPQGAYQPYGIGQSISKKAYRFEVRQGDRRATDGAGVDRVEFSHQRSFSYGQDIWLSWSFKVKATPSFIGKWQNIGQLHGGLDASPIFTVQYRNNNTLEIFRRSGSSGAQVRTDWFIDNSFTQEVTHRIVARIRPDPTGVNSLLQVWYDGVQVINDTGALGYTDGSTCYFKWGIYRQTDPMPLVVEYDNMEVGTDNLFARVASPLPIDRNSPAPVYAKAHVDFLGQPLSFVSGTSFTFSEIPLPLDGATRLIAAIVHAVSASNITLSAKFVVGGVDYPATVARSAPGSASGSRAAMVYASIPTGEVADLVVTSDVSCTFCAASIFALQNVVPGAPFTTAAATASPGTMNMNGLAADSVIIAGSQTSNTSSATWDQVSKNFEQSVSARSVSCASGEGVGAGSYPVAFTWSGTPSGVRGLAAAWPSI